MRQDYAGVMARSPRDGLDEKITQIGLDFGIATQFTSFVAVGDEVVTAGGDPEPVVVAGGASPGYVAELGSFRTARPPVMDRSRSAADATTTETVMTAEEAVSSEKGEFARAISADRIATTHDVEKSVPSVVSAPKGGFASSVPGASGESFVRDVGPRKPAPASIAAGAHAAGPWQRKRSGAGAEIVFAIDTTGSMSGLLDGAKRRIWSIVNEIMQSSCRPDVRIGLVAYRDRGDEYESQILPLTDDLDLVYQTLMSYAADGGGDTPEDVRRGLADAIGATGWSPAASGLAQIVFLVGDAPPHDYADEASPEATCAAAVAKGIVIYTIQCGADGPTRSAWQAIARSGSGTYFAIPSIQTVSAVERTPYDGVLADLGAKLGETYTPYGSAEAQAANSAKQSKLEREVALRASRSTAADRAINKAVNASAYSEDFLQGVENGEIDLVKVPQSDLPEDLRGLSPERLAKEVAKRIARRKQLRAAVLDISRPA